VYRRRLIPKSRRVADRPLVFFLQAEIERNRSGL